MLESTLKQFGLNEKEIRVYLAVLKLGPSPVRKIAKEASVNRGTTYDILKSLMTMGLISYYNKDKHQYFSAENPEGVREILNKKWAELAKLEKQVSEIIPQLKSIYDKAGEKPVVRYFEGHSGIRNILKDVLSVMSKAKEGEYFVYSSPIREYLYKEFPDYTKARVKKRVKVKVISIGKSNSKKLQLSQRKSLKGKRDEEVLTYILVYEGKYAMISMDSEQQLVGVIIEDKSIFHTQKIIFKYLWGIL